MNYKIGEYNCNVVIEKKNNKNTYIRVKENNTILITTNYLTTKRQIINIINDNKDFILRNLKLQEKKQLKEQKFFYLGKY